MKRFWLLVLLLTACGTTPNSPTEAPSLQLASTGFSEGERIPDTYTCKGSDESPPLTWQASSRAVRAFALTVTDPDAPGGTWDHWIVYNLPASTTSLTQNDALPEGTLQGSNSWGSQSYGGPCPPAGQTHHYIFTLYELDVELNLLAGASRAELESALAGHIIAQSTLTGIYSQ